MATFLILVGILGPAWMFPIIVFIFSFLFFLRLSLTFVGY